MTQSEGQLQFGRRAPGLDYPDRPAAFGIVPREGRIAVVRITRPDIAPYHDLPGGALDPGEDDATALVREFGEETGLKVRPVRRLGHARQYLVKTDGQAANNLCALFEAAGVDEDPALKIEADHELVWLEPLSALRRLRHDAHAWAVAAWLRLTAD
ncbi:NUDIX domain-containing protein [Caulobacter sp. S45]|uniref:NUDIX domain-containing protein n=1 Tax=Caulobacter sp. S45 TaxID=1641861 RepID=UPI001575417A|nr:NUDIX domain-containing protein [Caulobacter sp. S45]